MSSQDQIVIKLIEIQDEVRDIKTQMSNFVTKDEFYTRTDEMMVIIKRIDQELTFSNQRINRIEKKIGIV